jgi:hypothetical protein
MTPRLIQKQAHRDGYADRGEVEEFAAGLSVSHLQCRELGHNWRPWVARRDVEHNCFERALRCVRCKTKRWESIGLSGAKLSSHYEYPDGYTSKGIGRIVGEGRDALRLESLTRILVELSDQESQAG